MEAMNDYSSCGHPAQPYTVCPVPLGIMRANTIVVGRLLDRALVFDRQR